MALLFIDAFNYHSLLVELKRLTKLLQLHQAQKNGQFKPS
jgi:hypothetical protein